MSKNLYSLWLSNHHHGNHGVTTSRPPVMPPPPPPPAAPQTPAAPAAPTGGMQTGGAQGFGSAQAAGFFVAGFGANFFQGFNPQMNSLAQMGLSGGMFGFGFGMVGGSAMTPPAPQKLETSETALKHCGYKKGTKNTLKVGDSSFIDKGHGRFEVKGKDGEMFSIDIARCAKPPQIEIHAKGDKKKKAMMKVPLSELKKGGSLTLPDGTKLNMKANKAGNNMESFQVVSRDGQVATMDNFGKGNASWKTGGEAMKIEGPKLSAGQGLNSITKGGASPTPGQVAQGNHNHLSPIANYAQPMMQGMGQNPAPNMQQAFQQLQMMMQMFQMMQQMSQMFQVTQGGMFGRIGMR